MGKTPIFLAAGLVVGAVAIVWLSNSPDSTADSSGPAIAGDSVLASEQAALADRVTELEMQMSTLTSAIDGLTERLAQEVERADSLDAESAAALRDIQARLAAERQVAPPLGAAPGAPPGGQFVVGEGYVIQANGQTMRLVGPNAEPITVASVAAAAATGNPMRAPPNLTGVEANTGQSLVFRVTGSNEGPVWGTDVYTDDSSIAAAAVHAGFLQPGETGTIMVTVQDGHPEYSPSSRNGINSESYGVWERSFTMLRIN